MKIYNLTMHKASSDQVKAGVVELPQEIKDKVNKLSLFIDLPTENDLKERAKNITNLLTTNIIKEGEEVSFMIGGALFFMPYLVKELSKLGIPYYSFTKRVSEEKEVNGELIKTSVFKHIGFVPAIV